MCREGNRHGSVCSLGPRECRAIGPVLGRDWVDHPPVLRGFAIAAVPVAEQPAALPCDPGRGFAPLSWLAAQLYRLPQPGDAVPQYEPARGGYPPRVAAPALSNRDRHLFLGGR